MFEVAPNVFFGFFFKGTKNKRKITNCSKAFSNSIECAEHTQFTDSNFVLGLHPYKLYECIEVHAYQDMVVTWLIPHTFFPPYGGDKSCPFDTTNIEIN
jgi:hypothetical protein